MSAGCTPPTWPWRETAVNAIIPLAIASVLIGVLDTLGTPWGLFRHYWVLTKLLLTLLATAVPLLQSRTIRSLARAAEASSDPTALPGTLPHSVGGLVVFLLVMLLSITRDAVTRYGWHELQERRSGEVHRPRSPDRPRQRLTGDSSRRSRPRSELPIDSRYPPGVQTAAHVEEVAIMAVASAGTRLEAHYSTRRQAITVVAGAWLVVGVFVDGWAHFNRPGFETFFTPWHAVLYSGAAALFTWLVLPTATATQPDRVWAAAAAAIFTVGGLGDLLWHLAFGVETGLSALVSPTHLLLLLGGLIGVTAPLRESRDRRLDGFRAALPVLGAVTLAAALGTFFLLYVSPFAADAPTVAVTAIPEGAPGHEEGEATAVTGLASYLVSTVIVVVPLLVLRLRGLLPFGAITVVVTTIALLSSGVTQFAQPAAPVAALTAGLAADLLVRTGRRLPEPAQLLLLGAVVPLLLWGAQLGALALTAVVRWPAELVVGVLVLSTMFGAALALLAVPRRSPSAGAAPASPAAPPT